MEWEGGLARGERRRRHTVFVEMIENSNRGWMMQSEKDLKRK